MLPSVKNNTHTNTTTTSTNKNTNVTGCFNSGSPCATSPSIACAVLAAASLSERREKRNTPTNTTTTSTNKNTNVTGCFNSGSPCATSPNIACAVLAAASLSERREKRRRRSFTARRRTRVGASRCSASQRSSDTTSGPCAWNEGKETPSLDKKISRTLQMQNSFEA